MISIDFADAYLHSHSCGQGGCVDDKDFDDDETVRGTFGPNG